MGHSVRATQSVLQIIKRVFELALLIVHAMLTLANMERAIFWVTVHERYLVLDRENRGYALAGSGCYLQLTKPRGCGKIAFKGLDLLSNVVLLRCEI